MAKSLFPIIDGTIPTPICDSISVQIRNPSFRFALFGASPEVNAFHDPNAQDRVYYAKPTAVFDMLVPTATDVSLSIIRDVTAANIEFSNEEMQSFKAYEVALEDFLGKLKSFKG